ncbi:MAG: hypothetical protein AAFR32_05250 [Pseudomonadota bacterium]
MASATILPLQSGDPFPPAQVLDLAVSVAIGRDLATSEADMLALIKDWFLRPASASELSASLARLQAKGWIERTSATPFGFCLTKEGVDATTTLSGGMIRMIDRGRGHFKTAFLLQMLELEQGIDP